MLPLFSFSDTMAVKSTGDVIVMGMEGKEAVGAGVARAGVFRARLAKNHVGYFVTCCHNRPPRR